jgi:outer membrane receptor for ferrienterochelin and colicins
LFALIIFAQQMKKVVSLHLISIIGFNSFAQQNDSSFNQLNEVVITATRTQRKLSNVAVPVSIVSKKNIEQAASLRLNDILAEQAGLFMTSGFGTGVQMQGLNPDYTLILLNGEPLIGRTSGVLDLNRITVGNIKKIEIVKGPSSSLYGSEAMAGVINIITEEPINKSFNTSLRYGTYNTFDASANGSIKIKKLTANAFVNTYKTDGFSIRPFSTERTVAPLWRLTNQIQLNFPFSNKTKLSLVARYNYEHINNKIAVSNTGGTIVSDGKEVHNDFNINPVVVHQFNKKIQTQIRSYFSSFNSLQTLQTNSSLQYRDYFAQQFYRIENQTDIAASSKTNITFGAGYVHEIVNSSRYDNEKSNKTNTIHYYFSQAEYKPIEQVTVIAGLRYDANKVFAGAFSPKLAVQYAANKKLYFQASVGRGFKAPDFRQLYLNFTNTAAGSYSVFGAIEATNQVNQLNSLGLIQSIEADFSKLGNLLPETSTGINFGGKYLPNQKINISYNLFRNDIENMIDTRIVAYHKSGAQIFSYLNINKAFTQGFDVNIDFQILKHFKLSTGYQHLETGDKNQIEQIEKGFVFTKDANSVARRMTKSEYIGLPNRSAHMGNLKLLYQKKSFFINARAIYRSKWAVNDKDGNGLFNTNDEFANGFVQFNLSIGNEFKNGLSIQMGCDNISNYTDANNLPNLPGRIFYATLKYQLKQTNK